MLCQGLRSCTSNTYLQRGRVYYFYRVHFSHCFFGFVLFYSLSLFSTCSFPACCLSFHFFVYVNTYLQQSTFISHVVGFALSCCLLLSSYCLIDHFPHFCLGF
jgi:hypothetical protein